MKFQSLRESGCQFIRHLKETQVISSGARRWFGGNCAAGSSKKNHGGATVPSPITARRWFGGNCAAGSSKEITRFP
ncbi:MAG: hypothetical protein HYW48_01470 [Deltaproteobacteria bacterium]|nr:hypothetical protein [Deltaproteobacteria bacterium]